MILLLIAVLYILAVSQYFFYVPMWDAWEHTGRWIYEAVEAPFNILNFDVFGHPSALYQLILALPQYFDLGNSLLFHLSVLFFSLLSIFSFYKITKIIFRDRNLSSEIYLLTFIFSFFPIIAGNALHVNLDYGAMAFFLILLYSIFYSKRLILIISSIILVFTKETGIVMYFLTYASVFLTGFLIKSKEQLFRVNSANLAIAALPAVFFVLRIVYKTAYTGELAWWKGFDASFKTVGVADYPGWDKALIGKSYLLGIFVINFNWILTLLLILGTAIFIIKHPYKKNSRIFDTDIKRLIAVWIIYLSAVPILTFYKTFTNLRYFLPLYPLMIILAYWGMLNLARNNTLRRMLLIIMCLVYFAACFRTFDPVSRRIYGTFAFGRHQILKITSITGECCGYGRDQLVYNFEYLKIAYLLDRIFADLKVTKDTPILFQDLAGNYAVVRIDEKTHKRTLRRKNSFEPMILNWNFYYLPQKPKEIYFIEFPNVDVQPYLTQYSRVYNSRKFKEYESNGYVMNVYLLTIK